MTKIFIDTGSLEKIERFQEMGFIDGCTTNPKILAGEDDLEFEDRMRDILDLVDGPVSIEVTTNDDDEMLDEARRFDDWGDNVVVKFPLNEAGLRATRTATGEGIDVNMTACMAPNQALLAAKAGARYASVFMGRIGDLGYDMEQVVADAVELLEPYETELLAASVRKAYDVNRAFLAGADIVTVPPEYFEELIHHPRTESSIEEFLTFWEDR